MLTKKQRSKIVRKAKSGADMGKAGKAFDDVKEKAFKFYKKKGKSAKKAKEIATKTAGKVFWSIMNKKK